QQQTWAPDAAARKCTAMKPATEPDTSTSRSRNLSYIPEYNLFLLELVGKDRGPEVWTYRYRKGQKPQDPPSGLDVVTEAGKATLTWKGTGEAKIYRAQADKPWEAKYAEIATTKDSRFQDDGLTAGKTYFYRVGRSVSVRTQPRVLVK